MRPPFSITLEPDDTALAARVRQLAVACWNHASGHSPATLLTGTTGCVVDSALREIGAHEGSVWLGTADGTALVPVWNNGPEAARFVSSFQLSANEGITGMVYTTGLSACETEVCFNERQHRGLDEKLGVLTWAMLAVPLSVFGEVRGVITGVRLVKCAMEKLPSSRADLPSGVELPEAFTVVEMQALEQASALLGNLLEHRVQTWSLGGED